MITHNILPKKYVFQTLILIIGLFFAILPQDSFAASGSKNEVGSNLLPLKTFTVNLSVPGRYLKVDMELELDDPKKVEMVAKELPRLRDAVIRLLSRKTAEELLTGEGKDTLSDEIIHVSNITLGHGGKPPVIAVYFTEFIVQ